jgi:hypothetical protein
MTQKDVAHKYHINRRTVGALKNKFAPNYKGVKVGKKQTLSERQIRRLVYAAKKI